LVLGALGSVSLERVLELLEVRLGAVELVRRRADLRTVR